MLRVLCSPTPAAFRDSRAVNGVYARCRRRARKSAQSGGPWHNHVATVSQCLPSEWSHRQACSERVQRRTGHAAVWTVYQLRGELFCYLPPLFCYLPCFAIADHALGSSRCEAPTARWKRHKVRASGEGERGILQMTPELARIFASFQPSCKTDAKCGLLEHKKGATWPSPLPSAKAINLVPQRCDTRVAGTLKNGLSGHRSD
jgi:hypothetical protein